MKARPLSCAATSLRVARSAPHLTPRPKQRSRCSPYRFLKRPRRRGCGWPFSIARNPCASAIGIESSSPPPSPPSWPSPSPSALSIESGPEINQLPPTAPNLADLQAQLTLAQGQLASMRQTFQGMKFAELTGSNQPSAVGRVFIDMQMNKWYFFTCGMKPPQWGKTYALWLICNDQKIPAGTFSVGQQGTATLLGAVPPLPPNAAVSLAITDEPANTPPTQPTGKLQMQGIVE